MWPHASALFCLAYDACGGVACGKAEAGVRTNLKLPIRIVGLAKHCAIELTWTALDASAIAWDHVLLFVTPVFQAGRMSAHNIVRATFMSKKCTYGTTVASISV